MAEPTTVKFMGKDLVVTRNEKTKSEKLVMRTNDFKDVLTSEGVTEEMRKKIDEVDNKIAAESLKFMSDRILKSNKGKKEDDPDFIGKMSMVLGTGSGAIDTEIVAHTHTTGAINGKPYDKHHYGICAVTKSIALCSDLRKEGGLLKQIEADFEKAYAPKK